MTSRVVLSLSAFAVIAAVFASASAVPARADEYVHMRRPVHMHGPMIRHVYRPVRRAIVHYRRVAWHGSGCCDRYYIQQAAPVWTDCDCVFRGAQPYIAPRWWGYYGYHYRYGRRY